MLIEQLVGPVLGEDVMNFLLKPGETKMAPLLISHLITREGAGPVSFLLVSRVRKANYSFCLSDSANKLYVQIIEGEWNTLQMSRPEFQPITSE
jgi:hypothetical protein